MSEDETTISVNGGAEVSESTREALLSAAFVRIADTLTDNFDIVDHLHTMVEECVRIVEVSAGGLLLVSLPGALELVASSSEEPGLVGLLQLGASEGPSRDCFTTGSVVDVADIAEEGQWPRFRSEALSQGFRSVHATPMKLRGNIIGTLCLLGRDVGSLSDRDTKAVQALADAATIGVLQERVSRESVLVTEQLNRALASRIFIEQAKGVISQARSISVDEAFVILRRYARNNNLQLQSVSERIATRALSVDAL